MLGLLVFLRKEAGLCIFTPTSSFRPRNPDLQGRYAIYSRHGRVLLAKGLLFSQFSHSHRNLAVWDPISGDWVELPKLPAPQHVIDSIGICWNAAVLCASGSNPNPCDSIDCHLGRFLVVLVATYQHRAYVYVYSSQAGTWSEPSSAALDPLGPLKRLLPKGLGALAGNALYFKFCCHPIVGLLKYDMGTQEISSLDLPPDLHGDRPILLTTTELGGLGIARVESSRLHLWSGEADIWNGHQVESSNSIRCSLLMPARSMRLPFCMALVPFLSVQTMHGALLAISSISMHCSSLASFPSLVPSLVPSLQVSLADDKFPVREVATRTLGRILCSELQSGATLEPTLKLVQSLALALLDGSSEVRKRSLSCIKAAAKINHAALATHHSVLGPAIAGALKDNSTDVSVAARCCALHVFQLKVPDNLQAAKQYLGVTDLEVNAIAMLNESDCESSDDDV